MNANLAVLAFFTMGIVSGCENPPKCSNDDDCCSSPNPAYTCNMGTCAYNQSYLYDNESYNRRVRHCLGYKDEGGSGGSSNCKTDLPVSPDQVILDVPEYPQKCQSWCWAAAIDMVADYYGGSTQECDLAGYKSGYGYQCCSWGCTSGCDQTATPDQILLILTQYVGMYGKLSAGYLSEHALQVELSSGRPVIVMFQGSFSGHVAVVKGFMPGNPATYVLIDPWYGPQFAIPYSSIRNGPYGENWHYTISRISPRADGCAPNFNLECADCS